VRSQNNGEGEISHRERTGIAATGKKFEEATGRRGRER